MDRARLFVWQFRDALSTILDNTYPKNFDQNNFRPLTVATKPQPNHWQKKLPFLLSCWQHFAGILPLSQWLCRKSTTWFMSQSMRRHFSPVNECTISGCRLRNWPESVRLNIGMPVVRTDGRSGGRCTVTWLPNFLGWIDLWGFELSPWSNKISAENLKKYVTLMGRKMSPRYSQVMMVSGYSSLTAVN